MQIEEMDNEIKKLSYINQEADENVKNLEFQLEKLTQNFKVIN